MIVISAFSRPYAALLHTVSVLLVHCSSVRPNWSASKLALDWSWRWWIKAEKNLKSVTVLGANWSWSVLGAEMPPPMHQITSTTTIRKLGRAQQLCVPYWFQTWWLPQHDLSLYEATLLRRARSNPTEQPMANCKKKFLLAWLRLQARSPSFLVQICKQAAASQQSTYEL